MGLACFDPGRGKGTSPSSWAALAALLGLLALACPAAADPVLTSTQTPQGGGLVQHDVSVDFRDGLSRSGFIQITFSGNFDAASSLTTANWPDIQDVTTSPTHYHLQGGTGGGSSVDVVQIASLVVPAGEPIAYNAVVSRAGQNYVLAPEPAAPLIAAMGLVAVAALRARGRRRGAT
jgi:hypothetical protein